jgi:hypothetical protein
MAQYAPQQGDDFMAYPGSNAAPSYMSGDSQNPNFMNMHDSQSGQSFNPGFEQGVYGGAPGFQDQNFDQGGGYGGGAPGYDQGSYHDGDSSFVGGQPSHDGNSSFVGGHPSTHDGNSSFQAGHPSTHDGDSSFVGGHPSTMDGDSSFVGGHPSTRPEDESFVGGHPSTQSRHSIPGNPADDRGQTAFNASADGQRGSDLQVERISDTIHRETQGAVDGFAATIRILAELARRESSFTRGQRFAWRFITLAEAAEAGGDPSSAALRDAGEPTQNRVLVEVHGMLGGRGADISVHLESLERDARLDASDDWGIDSPVNGELSTHRFLYTQLTCVALSESQGIAFDQVELNRRGPPPTLADGLRRLGKPVPRGASGTSARGGPGGSTPSGRGGAAPSAGAGRGGRGPSPSPRGGGVARGRGGTSGGVFKSTGQPGF